MAFKNMENVLWQRLVSFERGKMPAYVGIDASRFLRCLKQLQLHSSLQKRSKRTIFQVEISVNYDRQNTRHKYNITGNLKGNTRSHTRKILIEQQK